MVLFSKNLHLPISVYFIRVQCILTVTDATDTVTEKKNMTIVFGISIMLHLYT